MINFDFKLLDLKRTLEYNNSYSWFWLTDGFYWLDVDNQRLFESSDDFVVYCEEEHNIQFYDEFEKCMAYQVVRFWEDMLEIMPDIINPTPVEIHQLFLDIDKAGQYSDTWYDYVEEQEKSVKYAKWQLPFSVEFFMDGHFLSNMHITQSPSLYFWRHQNELGDKMYISWDFDRTFIHEKTGMALPLWSANKGISSVDFDVFINNFKQFNDKFMNKMQDRIDEILSSDEIKSQIPKEFDFSILQSEHNQRILELEKTLAKPKTKDWETVLFHHQQAGII